MINERLYRILQKSKLFLGISDEDLKYIVERGLKRQFQVNDTIIKEGQTGHPLYVVIQGCLEVVLPKSTDGAGGARPTRIRLGRLAEGDCIGEYSLIDNKPASASVIAVESSEMIEISRAQFEEIMNKSDRLARTIYFNMLRLMISRARERNKELDLCYGSL